MSYVADNRVCVLCGHSLSVGTAYDRGLTTLSYEEYANNNSIPQSVYCRFLSKFKRNNDKCDLWKRRVDGSDF